MAAHPAREAEGAEVISASALKAHCGYPRALEKLRPKSANAQIACDKGTAFHSAVETWSKTGDLAGVLAGLLDDEVRGWLELLAMTWAPGQGMDFERALGLSPTGTYVQVKEPEPHVYVPDCPLPLAVPLLTAGRADVVFRRVVLEPSPMLVAHVRDWKTGRYPSAPVRENLQLTALAFAAADLFGANAFIREIYYARDGYLDADPGPIMLDSDEGAVAWEMVEAAAKLDDSPRPGPHCGDCWERRKRTCKHALETRT